MVSGYILAQIHSVHRQGYNVMEHNMPVINWGD